MIPGIPRRWVGALLVLAVGMSLPGSLRADDKPLLCGGTGELRGVKAVRIKVSGSPGGIDVAATNLESDVRETLRASGMAESDSLDVPQFHLQVLVTKYGEWQYFVIEAWLEEHCTVNRGEPVRLAWCRTWQEGPQI